MSGTFKGELHRTAELLVETTNEQGIYFAIAFLVDAGYSQDDIRQLLLVLKDTKGAKIEQCPNCNGKGRVETGIGVLPCNDCNGKGKI